MLQNNSHIIHKLKYILTKSIVPSPFQKRKFFDDEKLKNLALSITTDGLIEPIVTRQKGEKYELIAGERRFRAVTEYTRLTTIQSKIIEVDDLQARRISAAENFQREDFSAIESIEAIVEIVDAHLFEDSEYAAMGISPEKRVNTLLSKLHSIHVRQNKQSILSEDEHILFSKFTKQVNKYFQMLPKRLEWISFYTNDLPLILEICDDIRDISLKNQLNKSQVKAILDVKNSSDEAFQAIVNNENTKYSKKNEISKSGPKHASILPLKNMSAREIRESAEKIIKKQIKEKQRQERTTENLNLATKQFIMSRLGIPVDRIARQLDISQKSIRDDHDFAQSIKKDLDLNISVSDVSKKNNCPEPLIWSIALENMTDQERFQALNWGLLTWDHWYWNDLDYRFGDDWPGRIPAQLVAHTLFYFTRKGHLVFDPMAGGGVVPDVCLAFNRRCWSFDLMDRKEKRPEIETYLWGIKNPKWPTNSKEKPDLIFIDPPYFKKKAGEYSNNSISNLPKNKYLAFFKQFLSLAYNESKPTTRLAFLNADWRNFQGISAIDENERGSILITDYSKIIMDAGWKITQFIDCPLSSQRLHPGIVSQMQKKRTLAVVRRTLIIARKG